MAPFLPVLWNVTRLLLYPNISHQDPRQSYLPPESHTRLEIALRHCLRAAFSVLGVLQTFVLKRDSVVLPAASLLVSRISYKIFEPLGFSQQNSQTLFSGRAGWAGVSGIPLKTPSAGDWGLKHPLSPPGYRPEKPSRAGPAIALSTLPSAEFC